MASSLSLDTQPSSALCPPGRARGRPGHRSQRGSTLLGDVAARALAAPGRPVTTWGKTNLGAYPEISESVHVEQLLDRGTALGIMRKWTNSGFVISRSDEAYPTHRRATWSIKRRRCSTVLANKTRFSEGACGRRLTRGQRRRPKLRARLAKPVDQRVGGFRNRQLTRKR